ncbi:MAG TPA: hypothetical protein DDY29_00480 [Rhodobacteraceae bacterium]|jgi:hypothetical protein|nr:type-F conjugative transfer system secretin TraK [Paracoccaceae bacterium]HBG97251.1 hypothetical protein [Paracoccaceae bacterium]
MWRAVLLAMVLLGGAMPALATPQRHSVNEDGTVRFRATTIGITRVSVLGDRIVSIVADASSYDMRNDANTGDVFLRFTGQGDGSEGGYIVTESGMTVSYTVSPSNNPTETVLITIRPVRPREAGAAAAAAAARPAVAGRTALSTDNVIAEKITRPQAPRRNGRVATYRANGLVATVRAASAGAQGRLLREQEFYAEGVRAVWIQRRSLGPRETSWVIVVTAGS